MVGLAVAPGLVVGAASSAVAFELSHGLSVAVVALGAFAAVGTIVGIVYGVRWRIAYEVECKAREGERALNEALEDRIRTVAHERDDVVAKLEQATNALRDAEKTIARLEALPNLERVLDLMGSTFERIMGRVEELHKENQRQAVTQADRVIGEIRRNAA